MKFKRCFVLSQIIFFHLMSVYAGWVVDTNIVDSTTDAGSYNSIAVDTTGGVHIAYYDATGKNLKYAGLHNGSWNCATIDTSSGSHDIGSECSIAVDGNNIPQISYYDTYQQYSVDRGALKYAEKSGGSSWAVSTVDNSAGQIGYVSSIAINNSGFPGIAYYDAAGNKLWYMEKGSGGWSSPVNVDSGGKAVSLAFDTSGNEHISYVSGTALKYADWNGSSWQKSTVVGSGVEDDRTSIAVDASNHIHIAYVVSSKLYYAHYNGSVWTTNNISSDVIDGKSPSLVLLQNGQPLISYVGNGAVKIVWREWNGSSWGWNEEWVYDETSPSAQTSSTIDSNGIVYISYYTGNSELGYAQVSYDSDDDNMPDWWEEKYGLDPNDDSDVSGNPDGDGYDNANEYVHKTDPNNPDTDGDGLWDDEEALHNTDPNNPDCDGDGMPDGWEADNNLDPLSAVGDDGADGNPDGDAFSNLLECKYWLDPHVYNGAPGGDEDGDGLTNGLENVLGTNPFSEDTDNDGVDDAVEVNNIHTDPLNSDSDGDGLTDGEEVGYSRKYSFEDGFADNWTTGGDDSWTTTTAYAYDDTYSAESPDIGTNSLSWLSFVTTNVASSVLSFYYRTDTLQNHHQLRFLVNGSEMMNASGSKDWTLFTTTNLSAGSYTCRWEFVTDDSAIPVTNTVWIDNVFMEIDAAGTSPTNADTDADGLLDGSELKVYNTNPTNTDTDADGLGDGYEINTSGTDPLNADSDSDGMPDGWEVDNSLNPTNSADATSDEEPDGLNNLSEYQHGTNPRNSDSDSDGMPDGWEVAESFNPTNSADATGDADSDGLNNVGEYQAGSDPHNSDSDSDGMPDGWEVDNSLNPTNSADATSDEEPDGLNNLSEYQHGTNPRNSDSDSDGMPDGWEVSESFNPTNSADASGDADSDGLNNVGEYQAGSDPHNSDSDSDGMPDGWEVDNSLNPTNSVDATSDEEPDGLNNLSEYQHGTNPRNSDSDSDGMPDGWEVTESFNPADGSDATGDADSDGLNNVGEYQAGSDPHDSDSDNDGMPDGWEVDNSLNPTNSADATSDEEPDGLNNLSEYQHGTNPRNSDSDSDGMPDGWEVTESFDPTDGSDASGDADSDGLNNVGEYQAGSDPHDSDSDNDGMPDGWEHTYLLNLLSDDSAEDPDSDGLSNLEEYNLGTSPVSEDTDSDGMPDKWEVDNSLDPTVADGGADPDSDGLQNYNEYQAGTDPNNPDSDGDGLSDGAEVNTYLTNPLNTDSDGDGLNDGVEVNGGTVFSDSFENSTTLGVQWTNVGDVAWVVDNGSASDGTNSCLLSFAPQDTTGALRLYSNLPNSGELRFAATYDLVSGFDSSIYFIVKNLQNGNELYSGSFTSSWGTHIVNLPAGQVAVEFYCDHTGVNTSNWIRIDNIKLISDACNTDPAKADTDNDGLNDGAELQNYHTDPNVADSDGDGLSDGAEVNTYGSNPNSQDSDGDGMPDGWEAMNNLQLTVDDASGDADSDGLSNLGEYQNNTQAQDPDTDNDGLNDGDEVNVYGSDPLVSDSDGDTISDGDEVHTYGTNPMLVDSDGDTLADNVELFTYNTDPTKADTDSDGMPDNWEIDNNLQPLVNDAAGDADSDTLDNLGEFTAGTDPHNSDCDGDGLSDGEEVYTYTTNPLNADSDGDGLSDYNEVNGWGTDPNKVDTDGDGVSDRDETELDHTNPFSDDTDGDGLSDYAENHSRAEFIDSFERTNPGPEWQVSGNSPFYIISGNSYEGSKHIISGELTTGQYSEMQITKDCGTGNFVFWVKLTCDNTDKLELYIDDTLTNTMNGYHSSWQEISIPITNGVHTFKFKYTEDDDWKNDFVHIDLVSFPLAAVGSDSNDPDSDDDGLNDGDEVNVYGTAPLNADSDNDGITDGEEVNKTGTNPLMADTDGDGMPDGWELLHGLNPLVDDSAGDADSDSLSNVQEYSLGTWPDKADTDGDGMPDGWEQQYGLNPIVDDSGTDTDNDNLSALTEFNAGTRPDHADTDGDGMPDGWEVDNSLNPLLNDASADTDSDGLNNLQEYQHGTDPQTSDSDGDGLSDGDEVNTYNTNPANADSDNDGLFDGAEVNTYSTNPLNADSDGDGISDGTEVNTYSANPLSTDSDSDGLTDDEEINTYGSNPTSSDSDGDGLSDGREVTLGPWTVAKALLGYEEHYSSWPGGWTTGGDSNWTYNTSYGKFYAPDMSYGETSWLQVTTNTPDGMVYFELWIGKDSQSTTNDGTLSFYIDGTKYFERNRSCYSGNWRFPVTSGTHTFKWSFAGNSVSSDTDGASVNAFKIMVSGSNTDPTRSDTDGDGDDDNTEISSLRDPWNPYSAAIYQYWKISTIDDSAGMMDTGTGIAIDSTGTVHVCYCKSGTGLQYGTLNGSTWTNETAKTGDITYSTMAMSSNDIPHIACADSTSYIYHLEKSGTTWSSHQFSAAVGVGNYPAITLDNVGNPSIVYYRDSDHELLMQTRSGALWNEKSVFDVYFTQSGKCHCPAIVMNNTAEPQVVYYLGKMEDNTYMPIMERMHFASWDSNTNDWDDNTIDNLWAEDAPACGASLKRDSQDHLYLAYYDNNEGTLCYRYYDGNNWDYQVIDSDIKNATILWGAQPSLALDGNNNPWIAYYDGRDGDLKLARHSEIGWRVSVVDSTGDVGRDCSLAIDTNGIPHIIYYDATNQRFKYAVVNDAYYTDKDLDTLSAREEYDHGTNPDLADTDGDGLDDGVEVWQTHTSPTVADSDNDGISDSDEVSVYNTNPKSTDTDGDGMPDNWEITHGLDPLVDDAHSDFDSDEADNVTEYNHGLLPDDIDTDGDGLPDGWELAHGSNPLLDDADSDPDGDGATFMDEYQNEGIDSGPDSDNDGLTNGEELHTYNTDPLDSDSDNDGMPDGWEVQYGLNPLANDAGSDPDGDGLNNLEEFLYQLNPFNSDVDGDGLTDGEEVNIYGTSPFDADSDNDGLSDLEEVAPYIAFDVGFSDAVTNDTGNSNNTPQSVIVMDDSAPLGNGWVTGGDAEWYRDNSDYINAPDSAHSGIISAGQSSWLEYTANNVAGEISFYVKTDCIAGKDSLQFTIDGVVKQIWSGQIGWRRVAFSITNGTHIFRWTYKQLDAGGAPGSGRIDMVTLEKAGTGTNPNSSDTDNDGMGDGWEVDNGLNPNANDASVDTDGDGIVNSNEYVFGTSPTDADTDGDGQNDYEEIYITGMSPTNAASVFGLNMIDISGTNTVIRWPSVTGRLYEVWLSSNLLDGFVPVQSNIQATGSGYNEFTNSTLTTPVFYRVKVHKP